MVQLYVCTYNPVVLHLRHSLRLLRHRPLVVVVAAADVVVVGTRGLRCDCVHSQDGLSRHRLCRWGLGWMSSEVSGDRAWCSSLAMSWMELTK